MTGDGADDKGQDLGMSAFSPPLWSSLISSQCMGQL